MILQRTHQLLNQPTQYVVKALLQTRQILEKSESYYLGNKLYIDPYLYWSQQQQNEEIMHQKIGTELYNFIQEYDFSSSNPCERGSTKREKLCTDIGLEEMVRFEQFMKLQREQEQETERATSDEDDDDDDDSSTSDSSPSSTSDTNDQEDDFPGTKLDDTSNSNTIFLLDDQIGTYEDERNGTSELITSMLRPTP
jgi:hypothetical protein